MAKTSLGKVGILPKGEYSSATQYLRLDIVSYNGSSYLCIKDCIGIDVTNKEYWLLIAQKGDKGDIGEKGEKGDAGKDFSIYKTYTSISAMESDASNVPEGEFVLIASNVEDEDNAKLYVKGENSFVYLTDLSGATGIKGEKGEKGDKPVNGVDYNTPEEKEEFKNEVVSTATTEVKQNIETIKEEAIQEFNSNASTKTNEYNDNTTTKLSEYNTNANSKVEEYNSNVTQKTNTFNENATTQTETFNNNATSKTNDFNSNSSTKTDEFNTNYEEKLESINEASTSIEQERVISDSKYAKALKMQVTDVEQTQIYAENDEVEELKIKGVELTQSTREGYNLLSTENLQELNENGIVLTKENGIININGQSTATSFIDAYIVGSSSNYEEFLSAGTYLISGITGEALSPNFGILVVIKRLNGGITTILQNSENKVFNVNEGDTFRVFIRIPQNLQLSNVVIKPMIVAGTEEKPYEEYGASPSLDYPSEVEITKEQKISIFRKNILDTPKLTKDETNLAVSFEPKSDGGIKIYGTANNTWVSFRKQTLNVPIKQGTTIYSNYGKTEELMRDNNDIRPFFWFYDKDDKIMNANLYGNDFKVLPKDVYSIQFGIEHFNNGTTYDEDMYIELEISDKQPTQFQKYEATNITIPLTNSAIGQYADTIDRENSVQNKFIQELTLTGSESDWSREDTSVGTRFFKPLQNSIISNANKAPYALCTHFKLANDGGTYNTIGNLFAIYDGSTMRRIAFGSFTDISTVDEWKAKLKELYQAGTPVKIYYVSETIDKIPLSEEIKQELNKFKLYDNLNNVFIDKGSLSFKYNKSLSKELEEKDEMIDNLLTRVQALEAAQVNSVGGN